MQGGIVREKEIKTLRQCVFQFRSKNLCTLFLPRGNLIAEVAQCGASRILALTDRVRFPAGVTMFVWFFFFWKVVFLCFIFNYGEIYRHPTPTTCLQHRCMDAVRYLYR